MTDVTPSSATAAAWTGAGGSPAKTLPVTLPVGVSERNRSAVTTSPARSSLAVALAWAPPL